jgi:septum formation protein
VRIDPDHPLILGSGSPRRREMIAMLGVPFVVRTADVDESVRVGEAAGAYLERVAQDKLDAVRAHVAGEAAAGSAPAAPAGVLVADTIVIAPGGAVLGKPRDDADAQALIERLAGATHEVSTRFLLGAPGREGRVEHAQTVTTRVTFRAVSPGEAAAYAATGEGRDKAGAYAVQGRAAAFVERIDGSYSAVVGLPLSEVVIAMRAVGWLAG